MFFLVENRNTWDIALKHVDLTQTAAEHCCDLGRKANRSLCLVVRSLHRIHSVEGQILNFLVVAMPFVPSSFLFLLVMPGATSSVLAPRSDALCY